MNNIVSFINEVRAELRKITWPSKDELIGATIIVCILTVIFAMILGGMDFIFSYVIKQFII